MYQERKTLARLFTRIGRLTIPAALFLLAIPLHAAVSVSFDSTGLVVSGVTSGGQVVVEGVAREPMGYQVRISRRYRLLTDTDQNGSVTLAGPIPGKSVWAAVDLATGQYAVGWPAGSPASLVQAGHPGVTTDANGTQVTFESDLADVLVARSGGFVWQAMIADGGASDSNGQTDGIVDVHIDQLQPADGAAPFSSSLQYEAGDVVVLIDTEELAILVAKVNP